MTMHCASRMAVAVLVMLLDGALTPAGAFSTGPSPTLPEPFQVDRDQLPELCARAGGIFHEPQGRAGVSLAWGAGGLVGEPGTGGTSLDPESRAARNRFSRGALRPEVLVHLAPGTAPEPLRQVAGATGVRPVRGLPGWFVFRSGSGVEAVALADRLRALRGVLLAAPQWARQHQTKYLPADPLLALQWHLLAPSGASPRIDINVTNVWDRWRGSNSVIGIVDVGFEATHPDLAPNYRADLSTNFNANPFDPQVDWHGTAVAGLAAARGDNALGGTGVAYEASLVDLRLLGEPTTDVQDAEALAFGNDVIQVKNNSWGAQDASLYVPPQLEGPGWAAAAALAEGTATGREGAGEIYVFPAGNGRAYGDNANYDGYANSIFVISVGAVDDQGQQAGYSEAGACLAVCAPSGSRLGPCDGGLTTTDVVGDHGRNNPTNFCDWADLAYTTNFTGTSAAVPLVSGVAALVLEARPDLGWRDVKEILMRSATRVSPADSEWATNASGLATNPKFGAGLVNAAQEMGLATHWLNLAPMTSLSYLQSNLDIAIPDNDPAGTNVTFILANTGFRVETVALSVNLSHERRGDLAITLTSPSGMVSVLAETNRSTALDYVWTFTSVRDWGQDSQGDWTVNVADLTEYGVGTLHSLQLELYGSVPGALALVKTKADARLALLVAGVNWKYTNYTVQASPDLVAWTNVAILPVGSNGWACCVETNPPGDVRSYRACPGP
jgi:subtilisin-like proprotein convertase family protein